MKVLGIIITVFSLIFVFSCSDDSENNDTDNDIVTQDKDTQIADNEVTDENNDETRDVLNDESTDNITTDEDTQLDDDPTPDNDTETGEYGFTFRTPIERTVNCDPSLMESQVIQLDMDWLCTFDHGGKTGYVYLQHNTTSCEDFGMSVAGGFTNVGAWISIGGNVSTLTGGFYNWGGNHHNDSMGFDYNSNEYEYYHSSFGFGWRTCQNMDCINVNTGQNNEELGCTSDRTLPIVCVMIKADGTHEELVDNFAKCDGDNG